MCALVDRMTGAIHRGRSGLRVSPHILLADSAGDLVEFEDAARAIDYRFEMREELQQLPSFEPSKSRSLSGLGIDWSDRTLKARPTSSSFPFAFRAHGHCCHWGRRRHLSRHRTRR